LGIRQACHVWVFVDICLFFSFFILERRHETCCTFASGKREEAMLSGSDLGNIVVLSHLLQFPVQLLLHVQQNESIGTNVV